MVLRLWGLAFDAGPHNGSSSEATHGRSAHNVRRFIVLVGVAAVALQACGGSAGNKTSPSPSSGAIATSTSAKPHTPPPGIDAAVWYQFCVHGSALADALRVIEAGDVSTAYAATRLAIVQADIHDDSLAAGARSAGIADKMQAVSDAIGRAKSAIGTGSAPDWNAVLTTSQALPRCS